MMITLFDRTGTEVGPVAPPAVDRLPGGAVLTETWPSADRVVVALRGRVEPLDRHRLVDVLTACVLDGARHIRIDGRGATVADVVVAGLDQIRRRTERGGGSFEIVGPGPAPRLAER